MGLYRALAEKASDSNILSHYNGVIQSNIITTAQRENITKRSTTMSAKRSKTILLQAFTPIPENTEMPKEDIASTRRELATINTTAAALPLPKLNFSSLQKIDTLPGNTQADVLHGSIFSVPSHTHLRTKTLSMQPLEHPQSQTNRMQTRPSDRHLKLDNLLDQYVSYITTAKHYNVQNLLNEDGSPKGTNPTEKNGVTNTNANETSRERKFTARGKERHTSNGFATQRTTEIGRLSPMDINFNEDLLPLDKKSQKFLEIKKNRMRNKSSGSSDLIGLDKRSKSKENLFENIKERYQSRIKRTIHSSRSGTPNTRVLLMIKSPKIESLPAPVPDSNKFSINNRSSYVNYPTTGKVSLKSSISYPLNFDLPNDLDDLEDFDVPNEPETKLQLPLKKRLEEIHVHTEERTFLGVMTQRNKSARPMTAMDKEVLDRAKNDMNTKMLRMKYKKSMKSRQLRESQDQNLSKVPPGKGGVILDYQVNGNKQSYRGQLIQKVTKKKVPSEGFLTCRGAI